MTECRMRSKENSTRYPYVLTRNKQRQLFSITKLSSPIAAEFLFSCDDVNELLVEIEIQHILSQEYWSS